jgi:hypothetical protein
LQKLCTSAVDDVVKVVSIEAPGGLVVADVVDALVEAERHKYEFDANRVTGCLSLFRARVWGTRMATRRLRVPS